MAITTTAQLESYLRSAGIAFSSVEPLTGGGCNFLWRLTLPSGETRVVKHAEPHIASMPDVPFDVNRLKLEADALSSLPRVLSSADSEPADADNLPTVHLPAVHHFDSSAHILIMADGGLQNLKAAYPALPAPSIPPIGSALGRWIARLHTLTRAVPAHENGEARSMYRYAYAHLAGAFEKFGLDGAVARAIDAEFGGKLATDDACVCHGDFWPGNVLVRVRGGEGEEEAQLSVVDWEITRRGTGATDVAQFAAEAYLLERFYGDKGLLRAFLEAYVGSVQASGQAEKEEFVRRLVVHFGVHVAFWPTWVKWCEEDETKELVMLGREYMLAGREGNWKAVRKGPLEPVLGLLD